MTNRRKKTQREEIESLQVKLLRLQDTVKINRGAIILMARILFVVFIIVIILYIMEKTTI